ncbi:MAG: hypothetical protein HOV70_02115 [Streptomyces sp.]|nr:hypothetical protein [Streptomyces sp.]
MATGQTTALTQCPTCGEPLLVLVQAHQVSRTEYAIHIDLSQAREHIGTHRARLTTELPPTAR